MKCKCRCGYEWESRVPEPKECPQCKTRKNNGKRFAVKADGSKDGEGKG